jgi:hypothetical protein
MYKKIYKRYSYDDFTGDANKVAHFILTEIEKAEAEGWTELNLDAELDSEEDTYWGEIVSRPTCTFWIEGFTPKSD